MENKEEQTDQSGKSRADIFREHLLKAKEFSGSERKYCEVNGLRSWEYYHYKKKLGLGRAKKKRGFIKVNPVQTPRAVPEARNSFSGMDPKWLAEFLRAYHEAR